MEPRNGRRRLVLAGLFCFAPAAHVMEEPKHSHSRAGRRERARKGLPATTGRAAVPPASPTAETLAAYLGKRPPLALPQQPARDASAEEDSSIRQTSTYHSSSKVTTSFGDSGSGSSGLQDAGYDADSDCPPAEGSPNSSSQRRFRPAIRHSPTSLNSGSGNSVGAGREPATVVRAGAAEGEEAGSVCNLVAHFERLSMSSSSGGSSDNGSARHAPKHQQPAGPGTNAAAESPRSPLVDSPPASSLPPTAPSSRRAQSIGAGASLAPSRCSSARSLSAVSLTHSASGSISLAHFLAGPGSSNGRSRSGNGRRGGQVVRRGSAQLILADADSPSHAGATAAAAAAAAGPPVQAVVLGSTPAAGTAGTAGTTLSGLQHQSQVPAAAVVQRRLSDIHSGHFITLEKLRSQCGNFQEPPGDLLSLMARRVFASRSSSLLQGLCSQGRLSDLQADDSRLQTPSVHTAALPSPREPDQPPPPDQAPAQQHEQEGEAADGQQLALGAELSRLRPIRTRVGQLRAAGGEGSSHGSSRGSAGSAAMAPMATQGQ